MDMVGGGGGGRSVTGELFSIDGKGGLLIRRRGGGGVGGGFPTLFLESKG